MHRSPHPEQGFRACLWVMRLAKGYNPQRLENASVRVVSIGTYTYGSVESILKNELDLAQGQRLHPKHRL